MTEHDTDDLCAADLIDAWQADAAETRDRALHLAIDSAPLEATTAELVERATAFHQFLTTE